MMQGSERPWIQSSVRLQSTPLISSSPTFPLFSLYIHHNHIYWQQTWGTINTCGHIPFRYSTNHDVQTQTIQLQISTGLCSFIHPR